MRPKEITAKVDCYKTNDVYKSLTDEYIIRQLTKLLRMATKIIILIKTLLYNSV